MAIIQRDADTYLVRVYLGRDALTKKRIEINVTVHGTLASARKVEAKLKAQKEQGRLVKTPQMILRACPKIRGRSLNALDFVLEKQSHDTQDHP